MSSNSSDNTNDSLKNFSVPNPGQQVKTHEGEKDPDEEGTLIKEEDPAGMSMGTTFQEDKEQDLDDLIHSQGTLVQNTQFPGPDEV